MIINISIHWYLIYSIDKRIETLCIDASLYYPISSHYIELVKYGMYVKCFLWGHID